MKTSAKKKQASPKLAAPKRTKRSRVDAVQIHGLKGAGLLRVGGQSLLELRDRLKMTRELFGRIVNVSVRTLAKVESEGQQAEKLQRPYNEVYRLHQALSEVVDPNALGEWFDTPNPAFDGLKPIEVIERGEIDQLWEMAFRLRSGMPG